LRTLQHFDQPLEILPRNLLNARGLYAARVNTLKGGVRTPSG